MAITQAEIDRIASAPVAPQKLLIDGAWVEGAGPRVTVQDKFRLQPCATIATADAAQVRQAVDAAHAAFRRGAPVAYERGMVLDRAAALMEERLPTFVRTMQIEAGFTQADATGEVRRCIQTLRLSSEEARRLAGDVIPLAGAPGQAPEGQQATGGDVLAEGRPIRSQHAGVREHERAGAVRADVRRLWPALHLLEPSSGAAGHARAVASRQESAALVH